MSYTIIGAGPTGSHLAMLLSQNHDVALVEEHKRIGSPVQCTGILTDEVLKHLKKSELRSLTQAVVRRTIIQGPKLSVELKIAPNYVIDNIKHCQLLAHKAQEQGARLLTEHRYLTNGHRVELKDVNTQKTKQLDTTHLIGADGPNSLVAKHNGLFGKRKFLVGVQAVVKVNDYDERIHFYPHIGEYAWYCPEGDGRARIGVAAPSNAKRIFEEFIKKYPGKLECMQGGPIPLHTPRIALEAQTKHMRVQLIGDAALQIKNTTGGGIIPGMKAASIYAQKPDKYTSKLRSLNDELYVHYRLNKVMRKFTDKDWDKLIGQVKDSKVQDVLKRTNRDEAARMIPRLLKAKPSLMLWARKLL